MFVSEPWYSTTPLAGTSWFVKDFLPVGTPEYPFGVVFGGDPGSYKTTVLAAVFASLTMGVPFLGRKAKGPCETLLVAGEDPVGAKKRGAAVFTNLGVRPEEVEHLARFFGMAVNLNIDDQVKAARDDIIGQGMKPKVIGFDTMFACSEGADLTRHTDMIRVINNARRLCMWVGALAFVLTMHNRKEDKVLYGSVGLPATIDVIINFDSKMADIVEISNGRMKMDRKFETFAGKLKPVKIKIQPNDEGETEETWMVLAGETVVVPTAQASWPKSEKELFFLVAYLELVLGNNAPDKKWMEAVNQAQKKMGLDEYAERTWRERTKVIRERGLVIGGGREREPYRTVAGWWTQPGWPASGQSNGCGKVRTNDISNGCGAGDFIVPRTLPHPMGKVPMGAAHLSAPICTHSSQGGLEEENATDDPTQELPETEEQTTRKALSQLAARKPVVK
jgi:hypothetical protein